MEKNSSSSGIGFFGLLTITFIVLKLTKVVDWSWLVVLSPVYSGLILFVLMMMIAVYLAGKYGK